MSAFCDYYRGDVGRRFLLRQSSWLVLFAALLIAIFAGTDIDRALSRQFFDGAYFPLTSNWWLKTAFHDYARTLSAVCALAVVVAAIVSRFSKSARWGLYGWRNELAYVAIASLGSAVLVGTLKHFSAHACPWALAEFGGTNAYAPLFGRAHAPPGVEGCFPAAHPLSGYAWLSVALALYPKWRAKAWWLWRVAFALGTGFGVVQIMRGAHFLSHVLWTAWIVWAADVALLVAFCWLAEKATPVARATVRA